MSRRPSAELIQAPRGWHWLVPATAIAFSACQNDRLPSEPELEAPDQLSASAQAAGIDQDDWIVVFKDGTKDPPGLARRLVAANGGAIRFTYSQAIKGFAGNLPTQAIEAIQKNPNVSFVERDGVVQKTAVTWGLDRIDQRGLPLSTTFNPDGDGSGVEAWILDTGIDYGLVGEFGSRFDEDRDWDFVSNDDDASDCDGHGTHVAGTVGSSTYGVAKGVTIIGVRVLGCSGSGSYAGVIAGIEHVVTYRTGAAVANMSLSGGTSSSVNAAIKNAVDAGVVFAVAAGNDNISACNRSPASAPEAITVASSTISDARSSFSNYGSCVDLFAPGSAITSTTMAGGTGTWSGTSMATPHVAGAAALILQDNPGFSASQVWADMQARATQNVISNVAGSPNLLLYTGSGGGSDPCAGGCGTAMVKSVSEVRVKINRNRRGSGTVTVEVMDDSGASLSGVVVSGDWTVTGAADRSSSGTTGTNGSVTLSSGNIRSATGFSFCVTSLSKSGYEDGSNTECGGDGADPGDPGDPGVTPMGPLSASSTKKGKNYRANLSWTGGAGTVEVFRGPTETNLTLRAAVSNSGSYEDNVGKNPAWPYWYKVCSAGSSTDCSTAGPVSAP